MAKPFSIQAPEDVAKEYGGNKQAIAQAAQMGIVDPTAAVLAGMFIDRMRSAQVMEAGQQPTVAQQVLGGGGLPMPPTNPMAPGMGAPAPQPAPPMQAPMGAPPMQAPMPGMAMGGVASLPIPGAMFDEPDMGGYGDGYAGGGLVAFADGGPTGGWGDYIEQRVRSLDPNIEISGRARTPAKNAEVGGVTGSYHIIDAARDIRTPEGMDKNEFIAQLKSAFGPDYDILPSKGRSVHIEPGPKLGEKVRAGVRPSNTPATMPERDISTAEGRSASMEDAGMLASRLLARSPEYEAAREKARSRFEEMGSDEAYEKERKAAMWQTLAEIGFNMASSKSPYVLQAIGEAAAASMPGARADKKERKQLKDRALAGIMELGAEDMRQAKNILELQMDIYRTGASQEQFNKKLALDARQIDLAERKFNFDVEAARAAGNNISVDELLAQQIMAGKITEPMAEALLLRRGGADTGGLTPAEIAQLGRKGGSIPVGTVQDGYRFKGGDPGVEANWEKVK